MYRRNTTSWLKHWDFMLIDFILFQAAFYFAWVIRNGWVLPYGSSIYKSVCIVLALVDVLTAFFMQSYKGVLRRGYWRELRAAAVHVLIVTASLITYLFIMKISESFSRLTMICFPLISLALLYTGRCLWKEWLRSHKGPASGKRSMLLIGTGEGCREMADVFLDDPYGEFRLAGIGLLEPEPEPETEYRGLPITYGEKPILDGLCRGWVDEVFICLPKGAQAPESLKEACELMGITVHIRLARLDHKYVNQMVESIGGCTVLSTSMQITSPRQMFLKRCLDLCGGLVGVLITGLLTILIGPIIFIQSPGPIFFRQERVGRNGRRFKMYKFRSMYMDAEERKKELMAQNNIKDGMMFKMDNDPRIIKGIGHFIRDFSLDEFPQFINVLKGDMSLVGTRPPTLDEWEKYEYHHRARMAIKPGITGLWQVSGRSSILDFEEVVRLDLSYIRGWNIGRDIKILLLTVRAVIQRDGAK